MTHTPTPWTLSDSDLTILGNPERNGFDDCCIITDLEAHDFCTVPDDQAEANAALIVRAVNNHADLVAALEALQEGFFASLMSAATHTLKGDADIPTVAVPIDMIEEQVDFISAALAKAKEG